MSDFDPTEDPGWVNGGTFETRESPRVAHYKVTSNATVNIKDLDGPNHRIVLLMQGGRPNCAINAPADVPGNTRVEFRWKPFRYHPQIRVNGDLHLILAPEQPAAEAMVLSHTLASLQTSDVTKTTLQRGTNQPSGHTMRIDIDISHGADAQVGANNLNVEVGTAQFNVPNATLGIPLSSDAEVNASGHLDLTKSLGKNSTVEADRLTVRQTVPHGCILLASSQIDCIDAINGTEDHRVQVRAPAITVRKAAAFIDISPTDDCAVQTVTLGSATESVVEAGTIHVEAGVNRCDLTATDQSDDPLVVAGHWDPDEEVFTPRGSVAASTLRSRDAYIGPVSSTTIECLGDIHTTSITVDPGEVKADTLHCDALAGEATPLHVSTVRVNGPLTATGMLTADTLEVLGPDTPPDDAGDLTATAKTITVDHARPPTWNLTADRLIVGAARDIPALDITGRATVDGPEGAARILPGDDDCTVSVATPVAAVVAPPQRHTTVTVKPDGEVGYFDVHGTLTSNGLTGQQHEIAIARRGVNVTFGQTPEDHDTTTARLGVDATLDVVRGDNQSLRYEFGLADDDEPRLQITGKGQRPTLVLRTQYDQSPPDGPTLDLRGPMNVQFDCGVSYATFRRSTPGDEPTDVPSISTTRQGRVSAATGHMRLALPFDGRVNGPIESRREDSELLVHGIDGQPPATDGEGHRQTSGTITDFNPTNIPGSDLPLLDRLRIVDATPRSLRAFATGDTEHGGEAGRIEHRERAEWLRAYSDIANKRAGSGSAASAARWAMLYSHNESLSLGLHTTGAEHAARRVHRMLGYSNAVWPPFVTYLATAALMAVLKNLQGAINVLSAPSQFTLGSFWHDFLAALMLPVAILRLGEAGEPLFEIDGLNLLALIAMALPLAFFIVAVRNRLKEPGE